MSIKPALLHFKFEDFVNLPASAGSSVASTVETDCNGHKWHLQMYPGGREFQEGWVDISLYSDNPVNLDTKCSVSIKNAKGDTVREHEFEYHQSVFVKGNFKMIERSHILDPANNVLKCGVLHVDVTIQVKDSVACFYQPPNNHCKNMLRLLECGDKADITFNVNGEIFRAHSQILHANAPILAYHCDEHEENVIINDITPEIFHIVLKWVYSGHYPFMDEILKNGKDLINAANRFELVPLKLAVETALVQERIITKENVSDYILFADSQSCALLKEYAISFFMLHSREVLKSDHSLHLRNSAELLTEIIMLMGSNGEDMAVTKLRKRLDSLGLDVDGTKETLISRLEEARK